MKFQSRAILHVLFGLLGAFGFLTGAVLGILKLTEIGVGPTLSWGHVSAAFGVGALSIIVMVINMFKAMKD